MLVSREHEITDKFFSISFDNAWGNTTTIDIFLWNISTLILTPNSKFSHVICICHITNIIVQAVITHINRYLEKITTTILYIRTPSRHQQFLYTLKIFWLKKEDIQPWHGNSLEFYIFDITFLPKLFWSSFKLLQWKNKW